MIELIWPLALALLPLPFIVRYFSAPKRDDAALRVPFYQQFTNVEANPDDQSNAHKRRFGLVSFMAVVAWVALVVAASQPVWIGDPVSLPTSGRDLMIAVDISGSMKQQDLTLEDEPVTRLEVVKKVLGDFIAERKGDRLGLILFGTQAYLQAPLTFDRNAVETLLDESQIGFAGEQTAIGDAIGLATKRLRNRPETSRVLIFLTDGANTAGQVKPDKATEIAKAEKIRIHTIGIGATEMKDNSLFGGIFGRRSINPSADLDEKMLQYIAEETGGQYFRARDTQELQQIYAVLDQIEPIEQEAETFNPVKSLFYWPLALFIMLSVLVAAAKLLPMLAYRWSKTSDGELSDV